MFLFSRKRQAEKELDILFRDLHLSRRERDFEARTSQVDTNKNNELALARMSWDLERAQTAHQVELEKLAAEAEKIRTENAHLLAMKKMEIAKIEASNQKDLELVKLRLEAINEAHNIALKAKDDTISALVKQLELVTGKIATVKLESVTANLPVVMNK